MPSITFDSAFWTQPDSTTAYTGYELSTDSAGNKVCTLTDDVTVLGRS